MLYPAPTITMNRVTTLKAFRTCAVLRFPWRWRVIPSELIICRLHLHPQGNCRSVLRECIALPITENSLDPCSPESFIHFLPPRLRKNHFSSVVDRCEVCGRKSEYLTVITQTGTSTRNVYNHSGQSAKISLSRDAPTNAALPEISLQLCN